MSVVFVSSEQISVFSPAVGLKSGQSDQKRNSSMTNADCRIKEFYLFYLLKKEQSEATSTIRQSSIIIRHSMKFHTSAASGLKNGQSDRKRNSEKANIE